jgi:hypothetical protein
MKPFALILATLTVACAAKTSANREVEPRVGTYEFVASVPGRLVKGKLFVEPDTLHFVPETNCSSDYDPAARIVARLNAGEVRYFCAGAWLTFDRRNPAQSSKWFSAVRIPKQRQVCAQYATQNGRQVCVRQSMETYYTTEQRSGSIQVRRID